MKASELMIGNLIICNGELVSISDIGLLGDGFGINMTHTGEYKYLSNENEIEPIPLTDEWLLKLGFTEKDSINHGYLIPINFKWQKEFLYCSTSGTIALWNDEKNRDFIIMNSCKYVYQLQNLYFALTGEELSINK